MSLKSLHAMDSALAGMGLTRKQITREDSVFRAVSEKLFYSQCHHERVKSGCLAHLESNMQEYQQYIDEFLPERLKELREGKIEAGHLEMIALSHMYRVDFIIFHSLTQKQFCLTPNIYDRKIHLCYVEDNHYDLVYSKETVQAAAICQSIVYELLYKGVFGLDSELEEATLFLEVQKLLPKETTISG
ncbi:N-acetylglucosaminyldiphosphodolichol N-acetylglucosaminyltransferase catalytic subunit alg13 [Bulinus truncatus]|nr:N-acetylglucosaminyldiphosphodolichol N-acetylglucosaminyltransferase catalytic subunit alg13 [Bulinus truncatus]